MKQVVIESPLSGDFVRNYRYLLWCCRAVWQLEKLEPIASHLICPWFLDDTNPDERQAGIENSWAWSAGVPHWFFIDLGMSFGMKMALRACTAAVPALPMRVEKLADYAPKAWAAFERGEWPPHTQGFEIARVP